MYLITFKNGLNAEKSKIEFDRPLTFSDANEMLAEAVSRYKLSGQNMRISYKIIKAESGESIFNSKIVIDHDIPSLFNLIKGNSNAPRSVIDYVTKVENREITESDETVSFNNYSEEKERLEKLKAEKNDILQQLKKDEKERKQRDLEFQRKMKEIQDEKKALEKALQLKEKEEAVKESKRLESLRLLEEEKEKAMKLMEEKRLLDKKKKEEHEQRLRQLEEEAKKSEIELSSIETELEMKELERKREIQELEEKKLEANRMVNVLKAESELVEAKHQQELMVNQKPSEPELTSKEMIQSSIVVPKLTFKERLQELDFEEVKTRSIQMVKSGAKGTLNGFKKAFLMLKKYQEKRANEKREKLNALNKKVELEEQIAQEKIKFMEELQKDRKKQEREFKRIAKQKEKEASMQAKAEERYRAEKKKSLGRTTFYSNRFFKFLVTSLFVIILAYGCILYFKLGEKVAFLNEVENFVDGSVNMFINFFKKLG